MKAYFLFPVYSDFLAVLVCSHLGDCNKIYDSLTTCGHALK